MANYDDNKKVDGLSALTSLANEDLLITGDASETPAYKAKAITVANLLIQLALTLESLANKDTTATLGTSDAKYPSQKAVKTYVDALIAASTDGAFKLLDLGSTAVKIKCKNETGVGYTYLTFQDGQIIASDS
jgi:hypothetical protein